HLIAAHWAPVRGIKRQNHRLAAVVTQRDSLIRRAVQREVGRLSPGRKRSCGSGICVGHVVFLSQRFRVSDSSGTIGNSRRSALRSTAMVVRAPIRSVTSKRCRSSIPETVCPSKPTMMSPDATPARPAGLSGSTPVTSTPLLATLPSARCASRSKGTFCPATPIRDRKSTRLNSSHVSISYAVFCLKKKKKNTKYTTHVYHHFCLFYTSNFLELINSSLSHFAIVYLFNLQSSLLSCIVCPIRYHLRL